MNKPNNVIPIRRFSLTRRYFCYLDLKMPDGWYVGDHYIEQRRCNVRFTKRELRKEGSDYCIVLCSVAKRSVNPFFKAMEDLDSGLTLMRGREYTDERNRVMEVLYGSADHDECPVA